MSWGEVELEPEVRDWYLSLDEDSKARVQFNVDRLAAMGPLLDEPFTGLDPQSAEQVAQLLRRERDKGGGLILVSHDVHESWELATHVHLLVEGAWVSSGPRRETLDEFLQRYRAALHG